LEISIYIDVSKALYQGTTSVVPKIAENKVGL